MGGLYIKIDHDNLPVNGDYFEIQDYRLNTVKFEFTTNSGLISSANEAQGQGPVYVKISNTGDARADAAATLKNLYFGLNKYGFDDLEIKQHD